MNSLAAHDRKMEFITRSSSKPLTWWKTGNNGVYVVAPFSKPGDKKRVLSRLNSWKRQVYHHTKLKFRFHLCCYERGLSKAFTLQLLTKEFPTPSMVEEMTYNYSMERAVIKYRVNKGSDGSNFVVLENIADKF